MACALRMEGGPASIGLTAAQYFHNKKGTLCLPSKCVNSTTS